MMQKVYSRCWPGLSWIWFANLGVWSVSSNAFVMLALAIFFHQSIWKTIFNCRVFAICAIPLHDIICTKAHRAEQHRYLAHNANLPSGNWWVTPIFASIEESFIVKISGVKNTAQAITSSNSLQLRPTQPQKYTLCNSCCVEIWPSDFFSSIFLQSLKYTSLKLT